MSARKSTGEASIFKRPETTRPRRLAGDSQGDLFDLEPAPPDAA